MVVGVGSPCVESVGNCGTIKVWRIGSAIPFVHGYKILKCRFLAMLAIFRSAWNVWLWRNFIP